MKTWMVVAAVLLTAMLTGCGSLTGTDKTYQMVNVKTADGELAQTPIELDRYGSWAVVRSQEEATLQAKAEAKGKQYDARIAEAEARKAEAENGVKYAVQLTDPKDIALDKCQGLLDRAMGFLGQANEGLVEVATLQAGGTRGNYTPMPKGAVAETIDSATGLTKEFLHAPGTLLYVATDALVRQSDNQKPTVNVDAKEAQGAVTVSTTDNIASGQGSTAVAEAATQKPVTIEATAEGASGSTGQNGPGAVPSNPSTTTTTTTNSQAGGEDSNLVQ